MGILGYLLRGFVDPYFKEKAKNAATKEDVGEITSKVESIRTQLAETLNFKVSRRSSQEKHLLAFHDIAIELLHERFAITFGDFPMDDGKSLFEFQIRFKANIVTLLREYQRLFLFVRDGNPLLIAAKAVTNAAIKSQAIFNENFGAVRSACVDEQLAYSSGDKDAYHRAAAKSDKAHRKYWDEMRPCIEDFGKALECFVTNLNTFLSTPEGE